MERLQKPHTLWKLHKKRKQTKPKQNWGLKIATFVTMKLQGNIIVYTAIKT